MPQPALFTNASKSGSKEFSASPAFDKLQQLASQGYVTDPTPRGDGILLRHPSGPDLVLRPDGSIDLPLEQSTRRRPAGTRKISWRRSILFLIVLAAGILLGWLMTGLIFTS